MQNISRRHFLALGLCASASLLIPRPVWATLAAPARKLSFYNLHNGERIGLTYYEHGSYVTPALQELNHFLRDWRSGDVHTIDPKLFDQLHVLQHLVEAPCEFHVISGYRSPATNRILHDQSNGVASKSLHLEGKAIDICLPGKELTLLHKAALSMQAGGVGYYPASNFIHLDTGRVRRWG